MAASKTGVYFDLDAEKVVTAPPVRGVQLVAPGVEPTPDEERAVQSYRDAYPAPPAPKK